MSRTVCCHAAAQRTAQALHRPCRCRKNRAAMRRIYRQCWPLCTTVLALLGRQPATKPLKAGHWVSNRTGGSTSGALCCGYHQLRIPPTTTPLRLVLFPNGPEGTQEDKRAQNVITSKMCCSIPGFKRTLEINLGHVSSMRKCLEIVARSSMKHVPSLEATARPVLP